MLLFLQLIDLSLHVQLSVFPNQLTLFDFLEEIEMRKDVRRDGCRYFFEFDILLFEFSDVDFQLLDQFT